MNSRLRHSVHGDFEVVEEVEWSGEEARVFASPLLDNAAVFARHGTERTRLTLAKVRRGGELVGVVPLTRLVKYRGTRLLEPRWRRWVDPVMGPFARKTTCMVDASFMAFRHADPFLALDASDGPAVRAAVVAHLKGCRDVDNVMISEPVGDPTWLRANGFRVFLQLPLVRVDVSGCATFDEYLVRIGQKRRRNLRKERQLFAEQGGTMEVLAPPFASDLVDDLHGLLLASSRNNPGLEIPFEDLMNSRAAFERQPQSVIVARVAGKICGFFGFIRHENRICQCHGGLDYDASLRVKAYPNLIHAAVIHAIESGCDEVTLGPLNNEAKRRAGALAPVMASFWVRDPMTRVLMNRVLIERFQIYGGEVEDARATPSSV
jgi:predicted N-acyltransferase